MSLCGSMWKSARAENTARAVPPNSASALHQADAGVKRLQTDGGVPNGQVMHGRSYSLGVYIYWFDSSDILVNCIAGQVSAVTHMPTMSGPNMALLQLAPFGKAQLRAATWW